VGRREGGRERHTQIHTQREREGERERERERAREREGESERRYLPIFSHAFVSKRLLTVLRSPNYLLAQHPSVHLSLSPFFSLRPFAFTVTTTGSACF